MKIAFVAIAHLWVMVHFSIVQSKDSLLNQIHDLQLDEVYFQAGKGIIDSLKTHEIVTELRDYAITTGDRKYYWEAEFLEAYRSLYHGTKKVEGLIFVQEGSEKEGFYAIASRVASEISQYYWDQLNYEESLYWHLRLDELLSKIDVMDFPAKALYLNGIGSDFRFFGDYEKANSYFKRVAALPAREEYLFAWKHAVNNLGHTYRQLGKLDSSDMAFVKLLAQATETHDELWIGIASGNYGYNFYLKGEFESAIPLLEIDVKSAENFGDFGLAVGSLIPLADIFTQKGELQKAKSYIDKAQDYIRRSNQTDRWRNLYPVMSKYETAMNHPQEAARFLDSSLVANQRYNEKFSALQLMRANQELSASQRNQAIQQLNDKARRNRIIRNSIIAGLLLILIASLIIYRLQVKRNKAEQLLKDQELQKTQTELQTAKNLLSFYTQKIHENSRLILSLEEKNEAEEQNPTLKQLRESTVLTDEDWDSFLKEFRKIYPITLKSLQDQEPKLTPGELRYLLLLKLDLANHEIAHAMGISPASLRVIWHRLKKKLDLEKSIQPRDFFKKCLSVD